MDTYTKLFWLSSLLFAGLSVYLLCCTKRTPVFYAQILSGCGMFATSKIGRKFLGLEWSILTNYIIKHTSPRHPVSLMMAISKLSSSSSPWAPRSGGGTLFCQSSLHFPTLCPVSPQIVQGYTSNIGVSHCSININFNFYTFLQKKYVKKAVTFF